MLGGICSPCCSGDCPSINGIGSDDDILDLMAWTFEAIGGGRSTVQASATSARAIVQGTLSDGRYWMVSVENVYILDHSWDIDFVYRVFGDGAFVRPFHFLYRCQSGTTLAQGFSPETLSQISSFYVGTDSENCCCNQYGPTVIFPSVGNTVCGQSLSTPTQACDVDVNPATGNATGICKRLPEPFVPSWRDRITSVDFGDSIEITLTLGDWRLYRASPLP